LIQLNFGQDRRWSMKRLVAVFATLPLALGAYAQSLRFTGGADPLVLSDALAARLKAPLDYPEGEPAKLELRWRGNVVADRAPAVSGEYSMRLAYLPGPSVRVGESAYNLPVGVEGELEIAYGTETSRWLVRQENYGSMYAQARYKASGLGFILPAGFVRRADDPSRVHTLLTVACSVGEASLKCGEPRFAVKTSDRRFLPHAGTHEELLPESMRRQIDLVGAGGVAVLAPTPPFRMDCCYGAWRCRCATNCECNWIFCNNCEPTSCVSLCEDPMVCTERCLT
jgi:hypothetical protein